MLINMRNAMMAGKRLSAKSYVQDGLIAMWDGIENAGWGVHDPNATVWKNLVGGGLDITLFGSPVINSNNVRFAGGGYGIADKYDFTGSSGATISILAMYDSATALNAQGWSYAGYANRLSAYFENGKWYLSDPYGDVPPGINAPNTVGRIVKYDFVWDVVVGHNESMYSDSNILGVVPRTVVLGKTINRFRLMAYGNAYDSNYTTYTGNVYECLVYSRALTADEIAHNYAVDKARFNLPDAT